MLRCVDGRWGKCTYFEKDMYVGKSMHHYGEYGPDETEEILELAQDLCLDVGANIGCISQALEACGFEVVAFEPQPEVFKVLRQNIQGVAHNCGVGSSVGVAKMPKIHYSEKNNVGGLGLGFVSSLGSYDVDVVPLDLVHFGKRVGFIKIDVEGYELEVLKGATELIRKDRPVMYIEDDRPEKSSALREYIFSLGYSIEEHKPLLYRENNYFGLKRNVWDMLYASHNLICKPC